MNYAEIKTALRTLQSAGHAIPALNLKKEVLQKALTEILDSIEPEILEVSIEPTAPEIVEVEVIESTPAVIEVSIATITTPEVTPQRINPEHPALTEFKSIAKGIETALIWTIALVRSLIRFSAPYVKKALQVALRATIYTAVILQPKVELIAYTVGIWGMTIALRLIRNRGWAIA